jgi:hypothetical protein
VSFAQATIVAGKVAKVPRKAPGLPWSTIAVRVRLHPQPAWDEQLRAGALILIMALSRSRKRVLFGIVPVQSRNPVWCGRAICA